jgi:hypothetical protein
VKLSFFHTLFSFLSFILTFASSANLVGVLLDSATPNSNFRQLFVSVWLRASVEIGNVRRQEVAGKTGNIVGSPRRRPGGKHGAGGTPIAQIGGSDAGNALAITLDVIVRAILDHRARIVQIVVAVKRHLSEAIQPGGQRKRDDKQFRQPLQCVFQGQCLLISMAASSSARFSTI